MIGGSRAWRLSGLVRNRDRIGRSRGLRAHSSIDVV